MVSGAELVLAGRMVLTAGIVVGASLAAERAGPFIGAMIATLPLSAGPAYVFLAADHGPDFIATAAVTSLVSIAATSGFLAVYVHLAPHASTAVALGAALAAWAVGLGLFGARVWTLPEALALALGSGLLALALTARARREPGGPAPVGRIWHLALRAAAVMALVALVTLVGQAIGPRAAGYTALLPIVFSCLVGILQPRIGGRATAGILAHSVSGMLGYVPAFAVLATAARPLGSAAALVLALATCVGWNLTLVLTRRSAAP